MRSLHSIRSFILFLLVCATPVVLVGCDSGGSNGGDSGGTGSNNDTFSITEGRFTATVNGGETASGGALFGVDSEANEFLIYMLAKEKTDNDISNPWTEVIILDRDDPTAPSQTGPDSFTRWDMNSPDFGKFYGGPDGTVTITAVSSSELKGDFDLQINGNTVVGSFTAKPTDEMSRVRCAPKC